MPVRGLHVGGRAMSAQAVVWVGLALGAIGALGSRLGLLTPLTGFGTFAVGVLVLGAGLGMGMWTVWRTGPTTSAVVALVLGFGVVGSVAWVLAGAADAPRINDVSTDPDDPPEFVVSPPGRYTGYPGRNARIQREAYADLASAEADVPFDRAWDAVGEAMLDLGWEEVGEDRDSGRRQALDRTGVFRFVDDIVVRVRPVDSGFRVDVRSRSRVGRGDLGVNARRIRTFVARLRDVLGR